RATCTGWLRRRSPEGTLGTRTPRRSLPRRRCPRRSPPWSALPVPPACGRPPAHRARRAPRHGGGAGPRWRSSRAPPPRPSGGAGGPPGLADQGDEEEQGLLDRDLDAPLVDDEQPLARTIEDGAEVGADRRHQPAGLPDGLAERRLRRRRLGREPVRGDRLEV